MEKSTTSGAKRDTTAINHLYASELERHGEKLAAGAEDPQAFADHKEYMETLEAVLKEDKKESWEPNDALLD